MGALHLESEDRFKVEQRTPHLRCALQYSIEFQYDRRKTSGYAKPLNTEKHLKKTKRLGHKTDENKARQMYRANRGRGTKQQDQDSPAALCI